MNGNPVTDRVVDELTQEIGDLLDASSVGLYEFIWILRGLLPGAEDRERVVVAEQALDQLLAQGDTRLIALRWPSSQVVEEVSRDPAVDDWQDPPRDGTYLAVVRDE